MRIAMAAAALLLSASCSMSSTGAAVPGGGATTLAGTVEVLASGTMSETVILQVDSTGEVVALVGEEASFLREMPGVPVTVTGFFTDEGWSVDPGIRKFHVVDSTAGEGHGYSDRYED